jgi:hypothetical protein
MQNYWLGIMAAAFVLALGIWLTLVFYADRHPQGRPQNSLPRREVIGGEFEARDGGRQLMPIPGEANLATGMSGGEAAAAAPAAEGAGTGTGTGTGTGRGVRIPAQAGPATAQEPFAPRQREAPEHEQAQPQAERP